MASAAPKTPLTPEQQRRMYFFYAAFAALIFCAMFLVPVIVSAPVAWIGKKFLRKLEAILLIGVGCLYLILYSPVWVESYIRWYAALFGVNIPGVRSGPPLLMFAAFALVLTGITSLTSKASIMGIGNKKASLTGQNDQVLPTLAERANLDSTGVIAQGTSLLTTTPHSLTSVDIGNRGIPLGIDKAGDQVVVREDEFDTHGLLFGSTGAGKTETMKTIAGGFLDLGWSGLVLDLKEDASTGGLLDWCESYANSHAIGFQQFRLSDDNPTYWFNALKGMESDEARDTIIGMQDFNDAYYKALNIRQLGQVVTLLYQAHEVDPTRYPIPNVYDIGKILMAPDLPTASREMVAVVTAAVPGFSKDDFDAMLRPDKATVEASGGLGARLTAMYQTKVGRTILRPGNNRAEFDVTLQGLSYIGLDSLGKADLTLGVASSVLTRMAVYAADRTSGKVKDKQRRFLIIDEANFVNRRQLLNLLARCRSAKIVCIVCTQGPTDWVSRQPGEPDLASLAQNTNVFIIMSQGERKNAELCADLIGRTGKNVVTQRMQDGSLLDSGSLSTTIDFIISPDDLRSLKTGEAVIRVGKPAVWHTWTKIIRRDPTSRAT